MERRKQISKVLVIVLSCMMLFMTSCANLPGAEAQLSSQEEAKLTALLGDLNKDVPEKVRKKVGELLYKADSMLQEREAKSDYEMSDKEYELWEEITALLDKETIRQFGEDNYGEDEPASDLDYGKDTMSNLKKTVSKKDWKELNVLRNEYFKATETEDEEYDVDIETEIKKVVGKYKSFDADAIVLNLLDDKNQKNLGMFCITPDFNAIYQDGSKNGLNSLSIQEQQNLEKFWKVVFNVLPEELFSNFRYFKVGGDGEFGTDASVIKVDDQGRKWCLTVDSVDIKDDGIFPYTIVHEMAHYLSFNEKQVDYFGDAGGDYPHERYCERECVAKEDSYLQEFYNNFWKDTINDWVTDSENTYFYKRHKSQFVTEYAATQCSEDFAECFSAYVFLESADTPEVQEKLDFFDRYPELRQIKKDILKKVKDNNVYVNADILPDDKEIVEEAE